MDGRLGGPQSWSGHGGEEKNSQPLTELESPVIQPVAQHYTTELSWVLIVLNNIIIYSAFPSVPSLHLSHLIFMAYYFLSLCLFMSMFLLQILKQSDIKLKQINLKTII
jgi:hypothetical protein